MKTPCSNQTPLLLYCVYPDWNIDLSKSSVKIHSFSVLFTDGFPFIGAGFSFSLIYRKVKSKRRTTTEEFCFPNAIWSVDFAFKLWRLLRLWSRSVLFIFFFLIFSVCCFIGLMALHVLIVLWIFNVSGVTVSVLYFVMLCLDELIDRICVSVLDARA